MGRLGFLGRFSSNGLSLYICILVLYCTYNRAPLCIISQYIVQYSTVQYSTVQLQHTHTHIYIHIYYTSVAYCRLDFDPFIHLTIKALKEAEIIPGKHSDTRIKPLPLTNGHGRYIIVTPWRVPVSIGEWPLHITAINL